MDNAIQAQILACHEHEVVCCAELVTSLKILPHGLCRNFPLIYIMCCVLNVGQTQMMKTVLAVAQMKKYALKGQWGQKAVKLHTIRMLKTCALAQSCYVLNSCYGLNQGQIMCSPLMVPQRL